MQRLLDSCDITDPPGFRDYAIRMLVARLRLRSIKAARGCGWTTSSGVPVVLCGKASREDGRLLPADVGVR